MPVLYEIDQARGLIHTRCVGPVTVGEMVSHILSLEHDPACPHRLDVLVDTSEATTVPDTRQLHEIDFALGQVRDRVRFDACAVVAPSDALYGVARMLEVLAGGHFRAMRAFREYDEAETWLLAQLTPVT